MIDPDYSLDALISFELNSLDFENNWIHIYLINTLNNNLYTFINVQFFWTYSLLKKKNK
jgi:hypothetical protein